MAQKKINETTMAKAEKVKPRDIVEVTWTGDKFHKAGSTSKIHKKQAEKMYVRGLIEDYEGRPEDLQVQEKATNSGANTGSTGTNSQAEETEL